MDEFASYATTPIDMHTFIMPPTANVKLSLGDVTNTYCQFYVEKPPNAFHRWMTRKLLGIKIEII